MVVYDDADTLAFGTAYMSEDAYESPLSVLRFGWAEIKAATREEFEAFRREQTNLVGRNTYHSAGMGAELLRSRGLDLAIPFGSLCHAYQRFRIPEELREQVRQAWPAQRPRYWWPGQTMPFNLLGKPLQQDTGGQSRGFAEWAGSSTGARGVGRAHGGGRIRAPALSALATPAPSFFPLFSDIRADKWPFKIGDWPNFINQNAPFIGERIDFRNGDTRGFAYCYQMQGGDPGDLTVKQRSEMQSLRVGAAAIRLVDEFAIANASKTLGNNIYIFMESDEFFFTRVSLGIGGSIGSDV